MSHSDSGELQYTSKFVKTLPETVAKRVQTLLELQDQQLELFKEYQERLHSLEKELYLKYKPLFDARSAVINDSRSRLEIAANNESLSKSVITVDPDKGVPDFWLRALKNNPTLEQYIMTEDEAALKYLQNIGLEHLDDNGFRIVFEFDENPFFTNKVLKKTFLYERDPKDCTGQLYFKEAQGDDIHWNDGWSLRSIMRIGEDGKDADEEENDSFFIFFDTVTNEDDDDDEDDEGNEEDDDDNEEDDDDDDEGEDDDDDKGQEEDDNNESEEDDNNENKDDDDDADDDDDDADYDDDSEIGMHFEIGEELKDQVIPFAVHWYTGEARVFEESDWEDEQGEHGREEEKQEDTMALALTVKR